jgi:hypothetical protein
MAQCGECGGCRTAEQGPCLTPPSRGPVAVQNAGIEPEHRGCFHLMPPPVRAMQKLPATFLDPDQSVAAEGPFRRCARRVILFAGSEAEKSKFTLRTSWSQVDRPVRHGTRVQEPRRSCPFRSGRDPDGMTVC